MSELKCPHCGKVFEVEDGLELWLVVELLVPLQPARVIAATMTPINKAFFFIDFILIIRYSVNPRIHYRITFSFLGVYNQAPS